MVFGFQQCSYLKNLEIKTGETKSVCIQAGPKVKQMQDYKQLKCKEAKSAWVHEHNQPTSLDCYWKYIEALEDSLCNNQYFMDENSSNNNLISQSRINVLPFTIFTFLRHLANSLPERFFLH